MKNVGTWFLVWTYQILIDLDKVKMRCSVMGDTKCSARTIM